MFHCIGLDVRWLIDCILLCRNSRYLPQRFTLCTDAGSSRCLIPSGPILLSVLQLCRYALQTTCSYIDYLYPSYKCWLVSSSLYWLGCVRWLIGCILLCRNTRYLQPRFTLCTDAGSFRCLIPLSPILFPVLQLCRYALQTTSSYIYCLYPSYMS